jgi:D-alanyl-D-alanine endopeptidase (penicillin-binding protein 7)
MIFRSNLLRKLMVGLLSSSLLLSGQVSLAQSASQKQNTKQSTKQQAAKKKVAPKKQKQVRTSTTRAKSAKAPDEKRPSFAAAMGLRGNHDDLNLKSSVALIVDRQTHEVLFEKNAHAALPIASITKLMTSLVVLEAQLPLDETIVIEHSDVNAYPGRTRSRVTQGAKMTREQAMILSLMSSALSFRSKFIGI